MIREINVVTGVEIQRDMTAEEQAVVDAYVAPVKTWEENRQAEYAKLNQFELISDDSIAGNGTSHRDAILAIKAKFPKPE